MRQGIGLTDELRLGWLNKLRELMVGWHHAGKSGVLACSALKPSYRHLLNSNLSFFRQTTADNKNNSSNTGSGEEELLNLNITFVMLDCERVDIEERLRKRVNHEYIQSGAGIIDSQFKSLERPSNNELVSSSDDGSVHYQVYKEQSDRLDSFHHLFLLKITPTVSKETLVSNISGIIVGSV